MRLTWEQMYMNIAEVVAQRSQDPKTQVGAVLVKDNHIVGIGYNGEPRGNFNFNWYTDEKYDYVIHAELNAIANACAIGVSCVGCDIFVTLSPCHECMKLLIQHQIKRVYYLKKYRNFELTKKMADCSGIELIAVQHRN